MERTSLSSALSSSRMLDSAMNDRTGVCVRAGVGIRCRSRSLYVNIGHELSVSRAWHGRTDAKGHGQPLLE